MLCMRHWVTPHNKKSAAVFSLLHSFAFYLPDLADHEPEAVLCLGGFTCVIGEADAPRPVKTHEVVAGAAVRDADAPAFEHLAAVLAVVGVLHATHVKVGAEDEVRHVRTIRKLKVRQIAVVARGFALR